MKQTEYLPASILVSAVILGLVLLMVGNNVATKLDSLSDAVSAIKVTGAAAPSPSPSPSPSPGTGAPSPTVDLSDAIAGAPVKGDASAPVTLVEFSDYQCPFCGRFYSDTLGQINEKYIKTGKAKLVYMDFPLSFHPEAQPAAEAARCAGEQGKYWEFHNKVFENQSSMSAANYKAWAKELKLDTAKFNSCIDSRKFEDAVQADFSLGQSVGVSGTPTFFINGKQLVGAQPFSAFEQAIEAELSA